MAISSIYYDFVIKDKRDVERLISALTTPSKEVVKPARSISGKEAIYLHMKKWKNTR